MYGAHNEDVKQTQLNMTQINMISSETITCASTIITTPSGENNVICFPQQCWRAAVSWKHFLFWRNSPIQLCNYAQKHWIKRQLLAAQRVFSVI